jgi:hypothetical protein
MVQMHTCYLCYLPVVYSVEQRPEFNDTKTYGNSYMWWPCKTRGRMVQSRQFYRHQPFIKCFGSDRLNTAKKWVRYSKSLYVGQTKGVANRDRKPRAEAKNSERFKISKPCKTC